MEMFNPPHPGEILKELYIAPLGLTQQSLAEGLGVTRKAVSELLNGYTGVSIVMSIKLAEAFNTTPEVWLSLQQQYDLQQARKVVDISHIAHYRDQEELIL